MKYFICPCIFESKLGCSFVKISRLIEDGFIDSKFLIFLKNDSVLFFRFCFTSWFIKYSSSLLSFF